MGIRAAGIGGLELNGPAVRFSEGTADVPSAAFRIICAELLSQAPDEDQSLLEQGLDSIAAQELVARLEQLDLSVPYAQVISGASLRALELQVQPLSFGPRPQR